MSERERQERGEVRRTRETETERTSKNKSVQNKKYYEIDCFQIICRLLDQTHTRLVHNNEGGMDQCAVQKEMVIACRCENGQKNEADNGIGATIE